MARCQCENPLHKGKDNSNFHNGNPTPVIGIDIKSGPLIIPGGRLNKKDGLTRYGDSHVKDKTS